MAKKHYPLPKRFSAALSEKAYTRLRAINAEHGFGNNYCLTFLLENLDAVVDMKKLDQVYRDFAAEYGAPNNN
ncbi:MAG: hypothetical protein HN793_04085 [Rhodospirillaceae bacterium]|jgi:hypothetical protein|nr:hypothetical protein [Rhodospirillaceae bacterium]MBT5239271.1 hypothetical protein [Rhodospirillaceae bacterium]MBT5566125.1 hypothetical protein [Rhodospirillaceae bacterium]MBT6090618.1 hypothetical protein [Rhodospirillaceae bacterium]MBT6962055.1 hypothetical protein [Rhodospirillaceae bacterium]